MCRVCMNAFRNLKVYKQKNVPGDPIYHYFSRSLSASRLAFATSSTNHEKGMSGSYLIN